MYPIDLREKKGLIFGVASERSIAWTIAKILSEAGATLALSYQDERLLKRVEPLVNSLEFPHQLLKCDVTEEKEVDGFFEQVERAFGKIDFLVHSIAFAEKGDLEGRFLDTSWEGFEKAILISAYSLVRLTQKAESLMKNGGSIVALTYLASTRAVPNYNVMGTAKAALEQIVRQLAMEMGPRNIRVNAISAGPISTLASRGIPGFLKLLEIYEQKAPLGKVSQEDVARLVLFLVSDLSKKITGQVIFVDGGYSIII